MVKKNAPSLEVEGLTELTSEEAQETNGGWSPEQWNYFFYGDYWKNVWKAATTWS